MVARQALFDVGVEAFECAAADEQDVARVDLEEVLVRMLSATLGWNVRDAAFDDLQESLLHALAGDIAGDARVIRLAGDFVALADVDDALFGLLDVEIGRLDEKEEDVLQTGGAR
jgi:hypothetical protein